MNISAIRMKLSYAALIFVIIALFLIFGAVFSRAQSTTNTIGTLSFSPSTVKDAQAFSISLVGGPSNTNTTLWIDNGDGKGFRNFGDWVVTDQSGSIKVNRVVDCKNYATIEPGQLLPVGDRVLSQKVYLEYAGQGGISATATHAKDCRKTTTGGGTLKYIKTLLNIQNSYEFPQHILDGVVANNQFILGGKGCLQKMDNSGPGGGLWIVSEDGSAITERNSCLDAGYPSNLIGVSFHGITVSGDLHVNGSGDGFIKENYSPNRDANHAVFYSKTGAPRSISPLGLYNHSFTVLKDRILARNSRGDFTSRDLVSLSDWKPTAVATAPEGLFNRNFVGIGFGDLFFNPRDGFLFSVSNDGNIKKIRQLTSETFSYTKLGSTINYSFDNSTDSPKLAILEMNSPILVGGEVRHSNSKLFVYKLSATEEDVVLDKMINLPDNFPAPRSIKNGFGIWGDHIVVASLISAQELRNVLELWRGDQKIETVNVEDAASIAPTGVDTIMISKNGYVTASFFNGGLGTVAYLYKIGGPATVAPPTIPSSPGGGTTTTTPIDLDDMIRQIQDLLDQINRLQELLGRTTGGGGAIDDRPLVPDTQP